MSLAYILLTPLIRDKFANRRYKAVKVLTVSESGTDNPQPNYTHELDILVAIRRNKSKMRCVIPRMVDHFPQKGPHGEHYCFVLPVLGISLRTFRTASPSRTLTVHVVKPALSCILNALDAIHDKGIIHASELTHSVFQNTEAF